MRTGLYALTRTGGNTAANGPGGPPFAVGSPGPGAPARTSASRPPPGGTYDLAEDSSGKTTYGHTFIVVAPDGTISWRTDYGGAPHHTMYASPDTLLENLRIGLAAAP